jgi:hypothetical protein
MGLAEPGQDPRLRDVLLLALGAFGTALCIALMYRGMRAVMDIGGACADGGPYVPVQPCPDGVAIAMVFSSLGLFLFGGIATWYGAKVGGIWTAAPLLAWSGLFLALGWNFIDYGIVNPPEGEDVIWGWLIPGVLFIVMGAAPLVLGATVLGTVGAPRDGSGRGGSGRGGSGRGGPPVVRTFPLGPVPPTRAVSTVTVNGPGGTTQAVIGSREAELQAIAREIGDVVAGAMAVTPADPKARAAAASGGGSPDDFGEGTQALLDRLERLADLRDRGLLGPDEYETAKEAVVRELEARS